MIIINVLTFLGFQRNHKAFVNNVLDACEQGKVYKDEEYQTPESRFEILLR